MRLDQKGCREGGAQLGFKRISLKGEGGKKNKSFQVFRYCIKLTDSSDQKDSFVISCSNRKKVNAPVVKK